MNVIETWKEGFQLLLTNFLHQMKLNTTVTYLEYEMNYSLTFDDWINCPTKMMINSIDHMRVSLDDLRRLIDHESSRIKNEAAMIKTGEMNGKEDKPVDISDPHIPHRAGIKRQRGERESLADFSLDEAKRRRLELNEEMKKYLEKQRVKSTLSNQKEFLSSDVSSNLNPKTASRTGAIRVDRSIQMKRDRIENLEGPLSRTIFPTSFIESKDRTSSLPSQTGVDYYLNSSDVIGERLKNLESFLLRSHSPYGQEDKKKDVFARIKRLEQALLKIEQKYPAVALELYA